MKRSYYAKIEFNPDNKVYGASFYEFPTIHTFGNTYEEAVEMAKDALEGYIEVFKNYHGDIPEPLKEYPAKQGITLAQIIIEV